MMDKRIQREYEKRNAILNFFLRAIFGFLVPFVVINGLIYFLYTAHPEINLVGDEPKASSDPNSKAIITFTVDCPIPLSGVVVSLLDDDDSSIRTPIPYSKLGDEYTVEVTKNGSYEILVSAINKSLSKKITLVETLDNIPPTIDMESVILQANAITLKIEDNQSGINYDELYAIDDSGKKENPQFLDESSGTVSFRFEDTASLTIHLEDMSGNSFDTIINKP